MKTILFLSLAPGLAAATLPQTVGAYQKTGTLPLTLQDRAVWDEYGLQDSERATYEARGKNLTVTAYRLQDATAALAAFQWQRPKDAKQASAEVRELTKLSSEYSNGELVALGNYLLFFDGYKPDAEELANVIRSLPRQEGGPLPTLPRYLPTDNLVANSERYTFGPVSLAQFNPEISPAAAAFHLGTEIQSGMYKTGAGISKLAIFSFPSPEIARKQIPELEKVTGLMVKRSGPLVAAVFSPTDLNAAETLLSQVRYQAAITSNQPALTKKDNVGNFMLNLVGLVVALIIFCVVSGLLFGGMRQLLRRGGASGDGESMITLHLGDH